MKRNNEFLCIDVNLYVAINITKAISVDMEKQQWVPLAPL
jgi:hypothetical protein